MQKFFDIWGAEFIRLIYLFFYLNTSSTQIFSTLQMSAYLQT